MKRVIVSTQAFEDKKLDLSAPSFRFKIGGDYECLVPDETHVTNVVAAMYAWLAENLGRWGEWMEFPVSHETLDAGELTSREISYKQMGSTTHVTRLVFDGVRVTGRETKPAGIY